MTCSKLGTRNSTQPPYVFIDLSKAFDNVLHEHLLLTLQTCGISGTALRWFRNFPFDWQQRVVVNHKSSSFFTCNKGVPQGSVLGPLLFNIYVADLPSLAREHGAKMLSFADDVTLYCSQTSSALAFSTVSTALKDTSRALALRGLSINVSKTVAMVIAPHSRSLPTGVRLLLQNEEVKLVSQTRLLGIIIDDSLSWSPASRRLNLQESWLQNWCFTSYVQAIDPHSKKAILRLSDSARFGACCFSNHPVHADWSTRSTSGALEKGRSMPGRCSSPRRCLTTDWKFKADSLISSLVPTTVHHHLTLSPTVCSGVTPGET